MEKYMEEFFSIEVCKEKVIKIGKFQLKENRWVSKSKKYLKCFRKDNLLRESCIKNINELPDNVDDREIIYHILHNH